MAEETTANPTPQTPPPSNGVTHATQHLDEKLVPSFRLEQELMAKRELTEAHQSTAQELASLRAQLEKANSELASTKRNHSQEMQLIQAGFNAPSVRRFFRREYQAAVAEMPADKRPEFGTWLDANKEDPLYSVHFQQRGVTTAAAEAATEQAPTATGGESANLLQAIQAALTSNPNAGAGQPADNTATDFTDPGEIRKLRAKNAGQLGSNKDAIKAQLRARGLIK